MSRSFSLENYLWASFEALDDGEFFQWGFIFALTACLGTLNTTSSCFFLSSRLCESGLWIHMRIGLSLQLIRGLPLLYYCLLGAGAMGFVFDLSFHQGFILKSVLWRLNSLLDPPSTYPEAMQPRSRVAVFAKCFHCPIHFWFPSSLRFWLNNFFLTFLWCFKYFTKL